MKLYANRYGLIDSLELALAIQRDAERRRIACARRALRARRRAERRERWRAVRRKSAHGVSALVAGLRAAILRQAV